MSVPNSAVRVTPFLLRADTENLNREIEVVISYYAQGIAPNPNDFLFLLSESEDSPFRLLVHGEDYTLPRFNAPASQISNNVKTSLKVSILGSLAGNLIVIRKTGIGQGYRDGDDNTLESQLDRLVLKVQGLADDVGRTVKFTKVDGEAPELGGDYYKIENDAFFSTDENGKLRFVDTDQLHAVVSQVRSRISEHLFEVAPIGRNYYSTGDPPVRTLFEHDADGNAVCSGGGTLNQDASGVGGPACATGSFINDANGSPILLPRAQQGITLTHNSSMRLPAFYSIANIEGESVPGLIEVAAALDSEGLRRITFLKDGEINIFHHREWHIITSFINGANGVGHLEFFITVVRQGRENISVNFDHPIRDPVQAPDTFPITLKTGAYFPIKAGDYMTMNFAWKANTPANSTVRLQLAEHIGGDANILDEKLLISYREIATIDVPEIANATRNTANIATNTTNIAKNVTAIAANKAAIQNNTTDIASNTSAAAAIKITADAAKTIADLAVIATSVEFRADDRLLVFATDGGRSFSVAIPGGGGGLTVGQLAQLAKIPGLEAFEAALRKQLFIVQGARVVLSGNDARNVAHLIPGARLPLTDTDEEITVTVSYIAGPDNTDSNSHTFTLKGLLALARIGSGTMPPLPATRRNATFTDDSTNRNYAIGLDNDGNVYFSSDHADTYTISIVVDRIGGSGATVDVADILPPVADYEVDELVNYLGVLYRLNANTEDNNRITGVMANVGTDYRGSAEVQYRRTSAALPAWKVFIPKAQIRTAFGLGSTANPASGTQLYGRYVDQRGENADVSLTYSAADNTTDSFGFVSGNNVPIADTPVGDHFTFAVYRGFANDVFSLPVIFHQANHWQPLVVPAKGYTDNDVRDTVAEATAIAEPIQDADLMFLGRTGKLFSSTIAQLKALFGSAVRRVIGTSDLPSAGFTDYRLIGSYSQLGGRHATDVFTGENASVSLDGNQASGNEANSDFELFGTGTKPHTNWLGMITSAGVTSVQGPQGTVTPRTTGKKLQLLVGTTEIEGILVILNNAHVLLYSSYNGLGDLELYKSGALAQRDQNAASDDDISINGDNLHTTVTEWNGNPQPVGSSAVIRLDQEGSTESGLRIDSSNDTVTIQLTEVIARGQQISSNDFQGQYTSSDLPPAGSSRERQSVRPNWEGGLIPLHGTTSVSGDHGSAATAAGTASEFVTAYTILMKMGETEVHGALWRGTNDVNLLLSANVGGLSLYKNNVLVNTNAGSAPPSTYRINGSTASAVRAYSWTTTLDESDTIAIVPTDADTDVTVEKVESLPRDEVISDDEQMLFQDRRTNKVSGAPYSAVKENIRQGISTSLAHYATTAAADAAGVVNNVEVLIGANRQKYMKVSGVWKAYTEFLEYNQIAQFVMESDGNTTVTFSEALNSGDLLYVVAGVEDSAFVRVGFMGQSQSRPTHWTAFLPGGNNIAFVGSTRTNRAQAQIISRAMTNRAPQDVGGTFTIYKVAKRYGYGA